MESDISSFDVKKELEHIVRYFNREPGDGAQINWCSDDLQKSDIVYFHASDVKYKQGILDIGIIHPDNYEKNSLDINTEHKKIFASKSYAGHIDSKTAEAVDTVVFIVDLSGLNTLIPPNAKSDVHIFEDIEPKRILGWFVFDSDYKLLETSL